jgi:CHAD domain-containing protein
MVKLTGPTGVRFPDFSGLVAGVKGPPGDDPDAPAPSLELVPGARETLREDVWDTDDVRLARWGVSIRFRGGSDWTVTLPDPILGREREHAFTGPSRRPPAEAVNLLRAYVRDAQLRPVTRLRIRRRTTGLHHANGDGPHGGPLVELIDDEVSVLDGRRVAARFRELGVNIVDEDARQLGGEVVSRLRQAGARDADPVPLHMRALGPVALAPAEVDPGLLASRPTAGQAVRHALARSVVRLIRYDSAVRLGEHPEAVHQARVATRRLRSDLRTFLPLLDEAWVAELRDELKWLADLLGAVRDAEVQRDRLRERLAHLPPEDRAAGASLVARPRRERARARKRLLAELDAERYLALLERVIAMARAPQLTPAAEAPARDVMPELAARPWRRLRKAVRELGDNPPDQALHDVRIRVKRVRYAAEAVAPVVGKPARRFAKAAATAQDVLGEHQDACVADAWLRASIARSSREQVFTAGQLVGMERSAAEAARARWPAAWDALNDKKLRKWMRT